MRGEPPPALTKPFPSCAGAGALLRVVVPSEVWVRNGSVGSRGVAITGSPRPQEKLNLLQH